jgi:hypothetical protein
MKHLPLYVPTKNTTQKKKHKNSHVGIWALKKKNTIYGSYIIYMCLGWVRARARSLTASLSHTLYTSRYERWRTQTGYELNLCFY